MSVSIPGGERNPSTVTTGKKATAAGPKPPGGGKPGNRPAGKGPKGRKPIAPVKVNSSRSWGPIALMAGVGALVLAIIGVGVYYVVTSNAGDPWQERAAAIKGI